MSKSSLPEAVRVQLNNLLEITNIAAKQAATPVERFNLYDLKHYSASAAILTMARQNLDLSYHLASNENANVVVTIRDLRHKCVHVPFNRLLPGAKAEVWNRIGSPASFVRTCERKAILAAY